MPDHDVVFLMIPPKCGVIKNVDFNNQEIFFDTVSEYGRSALRAVFCNVL